MREIPLTRGYVALVDDEDYAALKRYSWQVRIKRGRPTYAARGNGLGECIMMHREIMSAGVGQEVDHVDGNPLNNTRLNLRFATDRQQAYNRRAMRGHSRYKGVQYDQPRKKLSKPWRVRIRVPEGTASRRITIGAFATETEAARAYDEAARRYHGEFARLNFPVGQR